MLTKNHRRVSLSRSPLTAERYSQYRTFCPRQIAASMPTLQTMYRLAPRTRTTVGCIKRYFSSYPEVLQAKLVRDNEFYEAWAAKRTYFYQVDLQGQLFLEETLPKNVHASIEHTTCN